MKLLILGANPETAGLVKKANDMGIYTIVTDYNSNAYAKQYASRAYNVDACDFEGIVKLAKDENVDGILVGVAESLMMNYLKVCKALNFPCYGNEELFNILVDKAKFKNICRKYDVPVVEEYYVSDFNNKEELKKIKLPVVVKPVDSCSSKGISVCYSYSELEAGIDKALSFSNSKDILIEKYMTGNEVVIYYIFQDGEPSLVAMCDRYTNKEQKGVAQLPTSYIFPSKYIDKYISEVDNKVKKMFREMGVQNGTMFIQSFVDGNGGVRFYEPGYRLNGAQEHYIVNQITGIDAKELMINFALSGRMSNYSIKDKASPKFKKYGCKLSPLVCEGKISTIIGLDDIKKMTDVISINPSYKEGDTVSGYGTLKQIVCRFFVVSDNKENLKRSIDQIFKYFDVLDEKGSSMLMTRFDTNIINEYE